MRYTDKTIPVECFECPTTDWQKDIGCAVGVDAMEKHILEHHHNYTTKEAKEYARLWTDGAYERMEDQEDDYYQQRREDQSE